MGKDQTRNSRDGGTGARLSSFDLSWALFLPAVSEITLDRAGATWAILAVLLLIGCVITILKWQYDRDIVKHQKGVESLFGLTEQVLAASDREDVLAAVVKVAPGICDATHGYILLFSGQTGRLNYVASTDQIPRGSIPVNAIAGPVTCFRSQETTEVPDADASPFLDKNTVKKRKQKSLLYAPLLAGDDCLGVLEVEDRKKKRGFSPEQRTQTEHLAKIAALGLRLVEQRRIIEQLHRTEKLAAVGELANAMSQELNVPFERVREMTSNVPFSSTAADLEKRLREVARQLERASSSVDRLVRFATPNSGATEEIDLNALLRPPGLRPSQTGRGRPGKDQARVGQTDAADQRGPDADPTNLPDLAASCIALLVADPRPLAADLYRTARGSGGRLDGAGCATRPAAADQSGE